MMGVENLILIDHDKVELSNTARQILYDESDVGKLKIDVAKEKIKKYTVLNSYILSISSMIGGLLVMAIYYDLFGIKFAYLIVFFMFAVVAVIIQNKLDILMKKNNYNTLIKKTYDD